jgi:broad specificity phosphatase PhoE
MVSARRMGCSPSRIALRPSWRAICRAPSLREFEFNLPAWGPRLPLDLWDGLHHLSWTVRMIAGLDHPEARRARAAAEWLEARCAPSATTIVVTHGGFRRLLSDALVGRGWKRDQWWSFHNWGVWEHKHR